MFTTRLLAADTNCLVRGIIVPYPYTFATANIFPLKGGIKNVRFSLVSLQNRFNMSLSVA